MLIFSDSVTEYADQNVTTRGCPEYPAVLRLRLHWTLAWRNVQAGLAIRNQQGVYPADAAGYALWHRILDDFHDPSDGKHGVCPCGFTLFNQPAPDDCHSHGVSVHV